MVGANAGWVRYQRGYSIYFVCSHQAPFGRLKGSFCPHLLPVSPFCEIFSHGIYFPGSRPTFNLSVKLISTIFSVIQKEYFHLVYLPLHFIWGKCRLQCLIGMLLFSTVSPNLSFTKCPILTCLLNVLKTQDTLKEKKKKKIDGVAPLMTNPPCGCSITRQNTFNCKPPFMWP